MEAFARGVDPNLWLRETFSSAVVTNELIIGSKYI